jgi:lysozyme
MVLDPQYLDAIKGFEGYNPNPAGAADYKQFSSGYGTKVQPGDENIPADQRQGVYEQRFQDEVGKASQSVDSFAPNLPSGVRAALTSLTYNAGPGWQQSGLGEAIKAGDFDKAQQLFLQYNHAGGKVDPGLTARRQKEAAWFGSGPNTAPAPQASPQSAAAMQVATTPAQPYFAPPAPPQGQPSAPAQPFAPPAIQPVQIQYAQRRPIDLSALRAQLANAPAFPRNS